MRADRRGRREHLVPRQQRIDKGGNRSRQILRRPAPTGHVPSAFLLFRLRDWADVIIDRDGKAE